MRIFKFLLLAFLLLIILSALYLSTLKATFTVEGKSTLNAPLSVVYNEVNNLKNWGNWGPWFANDASAVLSFPDTVVGKNAKLIWTAENGGGFVKTVSEKFNEEIVQLITINKKSTANMVWTFTPNNNNTDISWKINGTKSFNEKIYWFFKGGIENNLTPYLKSGLELLNKELILKIEKHALEIKGVVDYGGGYYLYQTTACSTADVWQKASEMFAKIQTFMTENKVNSAGSYFTLNHSIDTINNTVMFSACVPVKERLILTGDVLTGFLEPQKTFKAVLKGNYKFLAQSWPLIYKALNDSGSKAIKKGYSFEVYTVNEQNTPNPAEWVTEIYIPIQ